MNKIKYFNLIKIKCCSTYIKREMFDFFLLFFFSLQLIYFDKKKKVARRI